jgi:hypothetical protein
MAKDWIGQISAAWQKGVASIIETGKLLCAAKKDVAHGEWLKMFAGEKRLPFGDETARRLMVIAIHPILSNPTYRWDLPPSWRALYELCLEAIRHPQLRLMLSEKKESA